MRSRFVLFTLFLQVLSTCLQVSGHLQNEILVKTVIFPLQKISTVPIKGYIYINLLAAQNDSNCSGHSSNYEVDLQSWFLVWSCLNSMFVLHSQRFVVTFGMLKGNLSVLLQWLDPELHHAHSECSERMSTTS